MYKSVKSVKYLEAYKLLIEFDNSEKRVFDLTPYLDKGKYEELKDLTLFKTVRVKFDTIEWANNLDIDPEFLYDKSICFEQDTVKK